MTKGKILIKSYTDSFNIETLMIIGIAQNTLDNRDETTVMEERTVSIDDLAGLERKVGNLSKLVKINGIINSTLDIGKLLTIIMEIIKDIMETEASTLLLYDEKENNLVFKVALGESGRELVEKYRVKMGQGIAGWVAETRKYTVVNNVYEDKRFDPNFDKQTGFITKAIACTPLLFKGKLLGVIQAINPLNKPGFDEGDIDLFNVFADQAALAVQNATFFMNALEEERFKVELTSARSFQQSLIPYINRKYENIYIAAKSIAAREIGGEFHGVYPVNNNIAVALCDIHEKGIPGGLNASLMNGMLKALTAVKGHKPGMLIRALNKLISGDAEELSNISFFYGFIDINERIINFVNSGVAYPILVRDGISRYLKFRSSGFNENIAEVKKVKVKLQQGDYFVIFSDSMVNFKNRNGLALGLKRIMNFLQKEFDDPGNLIDALIGFAEDFTGGIEIREDISIIAFKVL